MKKFFLNEWKKSAPQETIAVEKSVFSHEQVRIRSFKAKSIEREK
jgi:hypothetical protein